jgi:hypothetical protein
MGLASYSSWGNVSRARLKRNRCISLRVSAHWWRWFGKCQPTESTSSVHVFLQQFYWYRSRFTTDNQSVCLGIEHPCETCDQILFPVGMLLSEICGLVSIGRPIWREGGSAVCNVITQWSESLRTRNHTLLSHLRLPQPGGPGSHIYIPRNRVAQLYPRALGFYWYIAIIFSILYILKDVNTLIVPL